VGRDGEAFILNHHPPSGDLRHGIHQPAMPWLRFDLRKLHVDAYALFHQATRWSIKAVSNSRWTVWALFCPGMATTVRPSGNTFQGGLIPRKITPRCPTRAHA